MRGWPSHLIFAWKALLWDRTGFIIIFDEWESKTTEKQRVTGSRLHDELKARNVEVGITTVREIWAEIQRKRAEVFIPLVHRPGDEAQVDFFEVTVFENGVRRKAWMFLLRLMYSKWDFTRLSWAVWAS